MSRTTQYGLSTDHPPRRRKQMSERRVASKRSEDGSGDPDSSGEALFKNHKVLFTIHPYGHGPGAPGCPCLAKQTQSTVPPPSSPPYHLPIVQNKPNSTRPTANRQKCAKQTQFRPTAILPPSPASHRKRSGDPPVEDCAKRTQSPYNRPKY